MRTSTFNDFRDFVVRLFKDLEQNEWSDELVRYFVVWFSSLRESRIHVQNVFVKVPSLVDWMSRLDDEMAYLKEELMKMEKIQKKNEQNLKRSEEERRRMEDEMIGADEERKKVFNEIR